MAPATDIQVGDLVMWAGEETKYSTFHRRVIYEVIERIEPEKSDGYVRYRFRPAYDFENPLGQSMETMSYSSLGREFKRINLIDLGVIRLTFDNFIKEWAAKAGTEVARLPSAADVTTKEEP